jgi:hypothetical protein
MSVVQIPSSTGPARPLEQSKYGSWRWLAGGPLVNTNEQPVVARQATKANVRIGWL